MALRLAKERTFRYPVKVQYYDDEGKVKTGTFTGVFRVLKGSEIKEKEDKALVDLILAGVEGLELTDEHGNVLGPDETLAAVRDDTELALACIEAYNEAMGKKSLRKKET